jgi:hypothetical protein
MRITRALLFFLSLIAVGCTSDVSSDAQSAGQGGSMTRFTIRENFLYVVDHSMLNVYNIASTTFANINQVPVVAGLETITTLNDYLYLGATDGMYIYSLANPELPEFVFRYSHIVSCDPVFVQGTRAYVTLRNGTACNQGNNALEIIDIADPYNPTLIANYPMTSPHGLAVVDNLLFLCEGDYGFKVFDITDEYNIRLLTHMTTFKAYDVIARDGTSIVTGEDGVFQFRFDDSSSTLELLSTIDVNREDV